jgi:hypothetical protein
MAAATVSEGNDVDTVGPAALHGEAKSGIPCDRFN